MGEDGLPGENALGLLQLAIVSRFPMNDTEEFKLAIKRHFNVAVRVGGEARDNPGIVV